MKILTYVLIFLGLLGGAYVTGTYQRPTPLATKVVEKVVYKDRVVYKEKRVAVDGSSIEREVSKEITAEDSKEEAETSSKAAQYTDHSLGLSYRVKRLEDLYRPSQRQLEVQAGKRLTGDLWGTITGSYEGLSLGLRFDF